MHDTDSVTDGIWVGWALAELDLLIDNRARWRAERQPEARAFFRRMRVRSQDIEMVQSGDTLAFRLAGARPSFWRGLVMVMLGLVIITVGGVGFGFLALALLRHSIVLGLLLAAVALFIGGFGLWILSKCVAELRVAMVVAPTIVEISADPLQPGEAVEILVAQAGPLRSKTWRVDLVGEEHTRCLGNGSRPVQRPGNDHSTVRSVAARCA